jgi:hypothetical protein
MHFAITNFYDTLVKKKYRLTFSLKQRLEDDLHNNM